MISIAEAEIFDRTTKLMGKIFWLNSPQLEEPLKDLLRLCSSDDELFLIEDLITRFNFYDSVKIQKFNYDLKEKIINDWHCQADTTLISSVSFNNKDLDGSVS